MKIFLLSITVVSSLLMVGVILLQQGKGMGMGASFGRGAQGGLYDAPGKANFLTRTTSILATIFLVSSLALSLYIGQTGGGILDELQDATPAIETTVADDALPQTEDSSLTTAVEVPE